ncbi:MAG: LapA family protein [Gammaproteobacteria bacterium]|nr:LapA family protein [Gammaproteobacteria bacterium]
MLRILSLIFFIALVIGGLSFAVLNAGPVHLNYYFGSRDVPLSVALVLTLLLGAVLGVFSSFGIVLKLRREIARLRKAVKLAEKEILNLRSIPIKDVH